MEFLFDDVFASAKKMDSSSLTFEKLSSVRCSLIDQYFIVCHMRYIPVRNIFEKLMIDNLSHSASFFNNSCHLVSIVCFGAYSLIDGMVKFWETC